MTDEPEFKTFTRKNKAEMRPYVDGERLDHVSISKEDSLNGSPTEGDYIARNPDNHADQWLVSAAYFAKNFEA